VSVADRGTGFDPGLVENPATMDGFGLFSIRERVRYLGGRVYVESGLGTGTIVTLAAPTGPLSPGRLGGSSTKKRRP
jgi:signal transduction histidine kinase